MSGLGIILRTDGGPLDTSLVHRMTSAMAVRGPHGSRHLTDGPVAFGHCMLRTTPEAAAETQPVVSGDGRIVAVLDGRFDNAVALRKNLSARGARCRSPADCELLLHAYEAFGMDCPSHLDGDFAFVIWDGRKRTLLAVRDRLGVKPLFFHRGQQYFALASDEEAFFSIPGVSTRPNEDFIAGNLLRGFRAGSSDRSWFADIVSVPPGTSLRVCQGGAVTGHTYWRLQPREPLRFASPDACAEAFAEHLDTAVVNGMRSLNRPALMLSGGIDSAAIAGFARRRDALRRPTPLLTCSVIAPADKTCSETANIRKVVAGYEQDAILASVSGEDGLITDDDLRDAAWRHAHPLGNSIILPAMMYRTASRAGVTVMHDGADGDLVMDTPELYMLAALRSGNWRAAWRDILAASRNNTYLRHLSPMTILAKCIAVGFVPPSAKRLRRRLWSLPRLRASGSALVSAAFAARIDLWPRLENAAAMARAAESRGEQHRLVHAMTTRGISWSMGAADAVAARYGIEARHVWADVGLVEFCLRLPLDLKIGDGWTKHPLRVACAAHLDSTVVWHSHKDHLGFDLKVRLLKASRDQLEFAAGQAPMVIGDYVDQSTIAEVFARAPDGQFIGDPDTVATIAALVHWRMRIRDKARAENELPDPTRCEHPP